MTGPATQCYYEDHYFESVEDFMEWAENNSSKWAENKLRQPITLPQLHLAGQ